MLSLDIGIRSLSAEYMLRSCLMLQSPYGHLPNNISQRTMPADHTSALLSQKSPFKTQGAIYKGDPKDVCVRSSKFLSCLQNPKSANLRWPDLKNMLLGLTSRCNIWNSLRDRKAFINCLKILSAYFSCTQPRALMKSSRVPPSQYSQMR